jgi:hypothetical protein
VTGSGAITEDGALRIVWRLLAGFGGGYALVSALVAASGKMLPLVGMARSEAVSLALLVALFVYVAAWLLMFASRHPWRDGLAVMAAAAALMALARLV